MSGLSDLPITSTIVEEDKHEDSSTITLDKEGKTLVVPVQTKLEEIQKNLEEEGSFVPAETEQQSYAFEQFVEETRGNQYTENATFAIILSWTALLSADWTDQERKKLKFGPKDKTSQWNQRILLERRNGLERYAWKLFEQYSYKAKAPTYNVDPFGELATENLITVINFNRFGDLLKEIASNQSFNDIDKTFLWSVIAKGLGQASTSTVGNFKNAKYTVDNAGVNSNLIDFPLFWNTPGHIIIPFDDGYHATYGGAEGDPPVDLPNLEQLKPGWVQSNAEWETIKNRIRENVEKYSNANPNTKMLLGDLKILKTEEKPWFLGGNRGDYYASMASVSTFREFRNRGFSGFAETWISEILSS